MSWNDCSTISSNSHFLEMKSIMYDPAVFLTDDEYHEKYGHQINVQATVEEPTIHILARCPSNDQQLLYAEERICDILQLNQEVITGDGIPIKDVMRVFKGDNPAVQLEAGQQKGGNYFCCSCKIKACLTKSIFYSFGLPHMTLQDRIDKITCSNSTISRISTNNTKYFSHLRRDQIICELNERRRKDFTCDLKTKELANILEAEMHGIQRLPALMFTETNKTLLQLNLDRYEILNNEPLHDVSNHTKNLYKELLNQFSKEAQKKIETIIDNSFNNKQAKNSSDYRKSLLIVCHWFQKSYPEHHVTKILTTIVRNSRNFIPTRM